MKIRIILILAGFSFIISTTFTGCIEDTIPTNTVTDEVLRSSTKAVEALMLAIPAYANDLTAVSSDYSHNEWGYGSIIMIRNVMTEEFTKATTSFGHFNSWMQNLNQGEGWRTGQFHWFFLNKWVLTTNLLFEAIDPATASGPQLEYLGIGHAFRAFIYLEMAQMYEFLENDKTNRITLSGNDILNYTVPIVTEHTTDSEARNNPRVHRNVMVEFLLSDLNKAEELLASYSRPNKSLPNLAVVFGIKARLYMWIANYEKAEEYARRAINAPGGHRPLTEAEWHNTSSGFNTLATPSWMWGTQQLAENASVATGIVNWTSWMSNEARFGYAAAGPRSMIDRRTYDLIDNDDWRKLSWKAPADHPLAGLTPYIDDAYGATFPAYSSVKFRPNSGNMAEYRVGAASAFPFMRIEEMYFIEAEAAAHQDAARGKDLLEAFMKQHRFDSYVCAATDRDGVVDEIFFQKRIEFWGEGISFFDYKRLDKPVSRGYVGTNHIDAARFNTDGRPAWMNLTIVRSEKNANTAIMDWENPDPSGLYTRWTAPQ